MNNINIIGRLTREPDLAFVGEEQIPRTKFTVAVQRGYGEGQSTDFIPVTVWRGLAEASAKYLGKGDLAGVTGSLRVRSYTREDGAKATAFEVVADQVKFLSPKKNGDAASATEEMLIPDEPPPAPQEPKAKNGKGK